MNKSMKIKHLKVYLNIVFNLFDFSFASIYLVEAQVVMLVHKDRHELGISQFNFLDVYISSLRKKKAKSLETFFLLVISHPNSVRSAVKVVLRCFYERHSCFNMYITT